MTEDIIIEKPTYIEHIRHFFTPEDKKCMGGLIDLTTYVGVRRSATKIYITTKNGFMPKGRPRWSDERVKTFENWIVNECPRGTDKPGTSMPLPPQGLRVRRNISKLSEKELFKFKKAFQGILSKSPNDPQSYYQLAGIHWLPKPNAYCRHHENGYNPWHRIYLLKFEDALRSIEGCEDVTMPYWDIQEREIPEALFEPPFDKFIYPETLTDLRNQVRAEAGKPTERLSRVEILKSLDDFTVSEDIFEALGSAWWEKFNGWDSASRSTSGIIRAHDSGHLACGTTMEDQNVAAFDPIFWFFHCNWDRLWWQWQQQHDATSSESFRTRLPDDGDWLTNPITANLSPFKKGATNDFWQADESIDSHALGVGYEHPTQPEIIERIPLLGNIFATHMLSVEKTKRVSVRIKNLDRLKIPGSFSVSLLVDGKTICKKGFFQPTTPAECRACSEKGLVSFDFLVTQDELRGEVSIAVELLRDGKRRKIPLSTCGDPTLNFRLLIEDLGM
ncbi:tyrosinase family protein [Microbulbifer epialgicus]|uniref:Tyrosinase family protein n=1 Tax=Microbulbifer epialgicus TaxID=393907 RepID=A0ABV4P1X4_9GAMM